MSDESIGPKPFEAKLDIVQQGGKEKLKGELVGAEGTSFEITVQPKKGRLDRVLEFLGLRHFHRASEFIEGKSGYVRKSLLKRALPLNEAAPFSHEKSLAARVKLALKLQYYRRHEKDIHGVLRHYKYTSDLNTTGFAIFLRLQEGYLRMKEVKELNAHKLEKTAEKLLQFTLEGIQGAVASETKFGFAVDMGPKSFEELKEQCAKIKDAFKFNDIKRMHPNLAKFSKMLEEFQECDSDALAALGIEQETEVERFVAFLEHRRSSQ